MDYLDDFDAEVREGYIPKMKRDKIDIPDFLASKNDVPLNEEDKAVLNNIPGNTQIEEMNHLNELEAVAQNWKEEEWRRVLYYAPHKLMITEIDRRMSAYVEQNIQLNGITEVMRELKLLKG